MSQTSIDLNALIRNVPDFPKPGIVFKDITPLLANAKAMTLAIDSMADLVSDLEIDVIAAVEARGFFFATPLAMKMDLPMIPIRKKGKLPYERVSFTYDLEYGSDTLEMHVDAVQKGQRVLVVDDLLATGGTVDACCRMIDGCGGKVVACLFLIELAFLPGREKLGDYESRSLLKYD